MTVTEFRLAYSTGIKVGSLSGIGVMQVTASQGHRWFYPPNQEGWNQAQEIVRQQYPDAFLIAMTPISDDEGQANG